jgi:hypothetical protein
VEAAKFLGLEWDKVQGMAYSVKWEHDYSFGVCFSSSGRRVSENRETALRFASDLANGLLILVEQDLVSRQAENEAALTVFQKAAASLKSPDPEP